MITRTIVVIITIIIITIIMMADAFTYLVIDHVFFVFHTNNNCHIYNNNHNDIKNDCNNYYSHNNHDDNVPVFLLVHLNICQAFLTAFCPSFSGYFYFSVFLISTDLCHCFEILLLLLLLHMLFVLRTHFVIVIRVHVSNGFSTSYCYY